jgi:hypothetical protein
MTRKAYHCIVIIALINLSGCANIGTCRYGIVTDNEKWKSIGFIKPNSWINAYGMASYEYTMLDNTLIGVDLRGDLKTDWMGPIIPVFPVRKIRDYIYGNDNIIKINIGSLPKDEGRFSNEIVCGDNSIYIKQSNTYGTNEVLNSKCPGDIIKVIITDKTYNYTIPELIIHKVEGIRYWMYLPSKIM